MMIGSELASGVLGSLVVVGMAAACGGSSGGAVGDPAVADAGAPDAGWLGCPLPPGRSSILTEMRFQTLLDSAFDLNGDGEIDNVFGLLPTPVLEVLNGTFSGFIQEGTFAILLHISDWTDPPTADDDHVSVHFFFGKDADNPPDPSNNLGGDGEFYANQTEFDINCQSTNESDTGRIVGGKLTATSNNWGLALSAERDVVEMSDAVMELTFSDDFTGASGQLGATMTVCAASRFPFPGDIEGSVLDAIVNLSLFSAFVTVDMDRDGDGLEQIIGDGTTIKECIDGDGTVVTGRDCPCDPRFVDGYSMAFGFTFTSAWILGTR